MSSEIRTGMPADEAAPGREDPRAAATPVPTDLPATAADGGEDAGGSAPADAPTPGGTGKSADRGSSRGLVLAAVLLLGVVGLGVAAWRLEWIDMSLLSGRSAETADRAEEVDAALDDLDGRLVRVRQATEALASRVDAVERQVATLAQSLDRVESVEGRGVDPQVVKGIDDRLGRLESQSQMVSGLSQQVRSLEATTAAARDTASRIATTVLAVGQLAAAVETGGPFVQELAAVRAMGGDDGDIARAAVSLEPMAGGGVPTLAQLRASFPAVADAVAHAEPVTTGDGWTDKVVAQLSSLVSVRRTGPGAIADGGVDGALAQTQAALDAGDLHAAVAAMEGIEGPAAKPAQDWLARARSRLTAEQAVATLQQRALGRLTAAKG